jgi:neutral ceramidase
MRKKSERQLRVGLASIDITPADSLPMGGYIARTEPAAGTHDPLFAKAVSFRQGKTSAILVALDILYVSEQWTRKFRKAVSRKIGLPQKNVLVAATHTHSGPAVFSPTAGRAEPMIRYEERLLNSCIEVAQKAFSSAEPSRVRVCCLLSEGIAMNRRDPLEVTDGLLSVVRIEDLCGNVKGHLASFPCHPTVMSPSNLCYSADLFGVSARELEKRFKDSTCIMFNGAAGDVSTRFTRRKQTWAELERLGTRLAREVIEASRSSEPAKAGPISAKTVTLTIPFREIMGVEEAQKQFEDARDKVRRAFVRPTGLAGRDENPLLVRPLIEGAAVQLVLSKIGGWEPLFGTNTAKMELQVIRVGDIIVGGLPGEFFGDRGVELKNAALPKFGFIAGYANGYWGYITPPEEAAKGGYETMMSPLHPSNEPKIIREAKALIREIKKSARGGQSAENV